MSITVRLAQPSPFVRKSKSRDQEKKASPPYHCQVMTLFWRVLRSSLVKRDIWRLRWFIGYFYGVTKTWKDQAGSKCIYIYTRRAWRLLASTNKNAPVPSFFFLSFPFVERSHTSTSIRPVCILLVCVMFLYVLSIKNLGRANKITGRVTKQ